MEGGTSPKFSTRREATDFSLLERERALLHHKCHHRSVPGDDLEQAACLFSTEIISLDALAAIAGRLAAPGRERFQDGDLPVMCDSQWDEAGICSSPTQGQEIARTGFQPKASPPTAQGVLGVLSWPAHISQVLG